MVGGFSGDFRGMASSETAGGAGGGLTHLTGRREAFLITDAA